MLIVILFVIIILIIFQRRKENNQNVVDGHRPVIAEAKGVYKLRRHLKKIYDPVAREEDNPEAFATYGGIKNIIVRQRGTDPEVIY